MSTEVGQARPAVNWPEIRARLERMNAALENAIHPSPERVTEVLEERARSLARVPPRPLSAAEVIDVATFSVAGETYAIETRYVRRIVKPERCTPVPGAPAFLKGVINLQGDILAVFDLLTIFGLDRGGAAALSNVVVLGEERDELGLVAEEVHEVKALGISELLEPSGSLEGIGRHLLRGLTAEALIVIDGAALLGDDRLVIDQGDELGV